MREKENTTVNLKKTFKITVIVCGTIILLAIPRLVAILSGFEGGSSLKEVEVSNRFTDKINQV